MNMRNIIYKYLILITIFLQVYTILANKTNNLINNNEDLRQYIEIVKQELKQMYEKRISELQHTHEKRMSELEHKFEAELEHKFEVLTSQISKLEQENNAFKIKQLAQSGTGFTAVNYERITYLDGQIIQFEVEVYDGNNNYDHTTGLYTCPANGMYLFSFEIFGLNDVGSSYCINKDTSELSCSHSADNQDGTASLVTHCNNGTQISVRASRGGTTPWGAYEGIPLSSFSGVLIAIDA